MHLVDFNWNGYYWNILLVYFRLTIDPRVMGLRGMIRFWISRSREEDLMALVTLLVTDFMGLLVKGLCEEEERR